MPDDPNIPQGTPPEPGAGGKPPDAPKYDPPSNDDIIRQQAKYYARDFKKRDGAGFVKLMDAIEDEVGEPIFHQAPAAQKGDDPQVVNRVIQIERDNAKLRATLKHKDVLSEDDIRILDGTPEEIEAKAEYLAERLRGATPQQSPGNGTPAPPATSKPEQKDLPAYNSSGDAMFQAAAKNIGVDKNPIVARAYNDFTDAVRAKNPLG